MSGPTAAEASNDTNSLYRRFRPQRFSDVIGQPHLVGALQASVRDGTVGHAYMLSGPRGTGKTSAARILARALNCESLGRDGEPCLQCRSCRAISRGASMDLAELDAASNNSVDSMRDLISRVDLMTGGRKKVYLLDEVHMLSNSAANALLKTLEEPPAHVVFILATTDPNKVLPTIQSRTQHFRLGLVGGREMHDHVRRVLAAAGLSIPGEAVHWAIQQGGGSVRDTLSNLDSIVASGTVPVTAKAEDALVDAIGSGSLDDCFGTIRDIIDAGIDGQDLAERTARRMRDIFLLHGGRKPDYLAPSDAESVTELASKISRRTAVMAMEALGEALARMPSAGDRRLTLEAAVVKMLKDRS